MPRIAVLLAATFVLASPCVAGDLTGAKQEGSSAGEIDQQQRKRAPYLSTAEIAAIQYRQQCGNVSAGGTPVAEETLGGN